MRKNNFLNKYIIVLLYFFIMPTALAEYNEFDLQNLFTSQQQRKLINNKRNGNVIQKIKKQPQQQKIKLKGYMKRTGGKSVVWINDKNSLQSNQIDRAKVYNDTIGNNKTVTIRVNGKIKQLQPGRHWNKITGRISKK